LGWSKFAQTVNHQVSTRFFKGGTRVGRSHRNALHSATLRRYNSGDGIFKNDAPFRRDTNLLSRFQENFWVRLPPRHIFRTDKSVKQICHLELLNGELNVNARGGRSDCQFEPQFLQPTNQFHRSRQGHKPSASDFSVKRFFPCTPFSYLLVSRVGHKLLYDGIVSLPESFPEKLGRHDEPDFLAQLHNNWAQDAVGFSR
jgi:hypothetical protein